MPLFKQKVPLIINKDDVSAEPNTICQLLTMLHEIAVIEKRPNQADIIKKAYIMAKKMNRKLMQYKFGRLPDFPNNSWNEVDWQKDLTYEVKK